MQNISENSHRIIGRNAVLEALKSGRTIEKILVGKGTEGSVQKIVGTARDRKIPLRFCEKSELEMRPVEETIKAWWLLHLPMPMPQWRTFSPWRKSEGGSFVIL